MREIIHFTMSNSYGGAETVIFSIISSLKDKNRFKYIAPDGKIKTRVESIGIKFEVLNLKNIIKEINSSDIIHSHDFTASVLVSIFSKNKNIVSHLHTNHKWLNKISLKSIVYLIFSLKFKKIIIVSNSMANEMWFYNLIKNKTEILINPIEYKKIIEKSNEYYIRETYDIVFMGRLSDYKNPLRFIEIIKILIEEKPNLKAILIGDGELKDDCINIINMYGIKDNIELVGFVENPFPYIQRSKLLLMPSKVEALGLSAIEAMVLGKPVVASKVGGLRDFINDKNGRLCTTNKEFKESILEILDNIELYQKLSEEAKKITELSDLNEYISKIEKIYN